MDTTDTKAIKGWKQIKKAAPNVWEKAKPILNSVIEDGVKKYLDLCSEQAHHDFHHIAALASHENFLYHRRHDHPYPRASR